ncbi:MAG: hypothetical protein ACMG6E_00990 [Candidatus Roizmanbacteria bacterium]
MKTITGAVLQHGLWVAFTGIDALNFHFVNKRIHVDTINLILIKNDLAPNHDFEMAHAELLTRLSAEMNTYLQQAVIRDDCEQTNELLQELGISDVQGEFFIPYEGSIVLNNSSYDVIIVKVDQTDDALLTFDRYGLRYVTLKDARKNLVSKMEKTTFHKALRRNSLTLSHWTAESLAKECFPCVACDRYGSMTNVKQRISKRASCATFECSKEMTDTLSRECELATHEERIDNVRKMVILNELLARASQMNLIPDDNEFHEALNNPFNTIIIDEINREIL